MRAWYRGMGISVAMMMALSAWRSSWCQDPPYRPSLQWHIAATNNVMPAAFTEDGAYLLATSADGYLAMVFRTQELLDPATPKGRALVSYDYCPQAVSFYTAQSIGDPNLLSRAQNYAARVIMLFNFGAGC